MWHIFYKDFCEESFSAKQVDVGVYQLQHLLTVQRCEPGCNEIFIVKLNFTLKSSRSTNPQNTRYLYQCVFHFCSELVDFSLNGSWFIAGTLIPKGKNWPVVNTNRLTLKRCLLHCHHISICYNYETNLSNTHTAVHYLKSMFSISVNDFLKQTLTCPWQQCFWLLTHLLRQIGKNFLC